MKDINLIPERYFVRQSTVRHTIAWGIVLALAVFSVVGGAIWQFGRLATARKALQNYTRSADSVLPLREQLQQGKGIDRVFFASQNWEACHFNQTMT